MDVRARAVLGAAVILLVMYKLAMAGGIPTVLLWVAGIVLILQLHHEQDHDRPPLLCGGRQY